MGLTLLLFLGQALLWGVPSGATEEAEALCSGTACYTIHWGKYSWTDSQNRCKSNGGNLVTLKNQEEALHIQDLLAKLPRREAGLVSLWIGLYRDKGTCHQQHQPLKGFRWVAGGEEKSRYSAWLREPQETCTARRCATLRWDTTPSSPGLGWADGACKLPAGPQGYLCKFSFQGMCLPLALAGPGRVTYTTPFGLASASLGAVPFGSLASVRCEPPAAPAGAFPVCKGQAGGDFAWSSRGPLCASPRHGCAYSNGGCAQRCLQPAGGSLRCACRPGYTLAADGLSCADLDECARGAAPCAQLCANAPGSFHCACRPGWELGPDGLACLLRGSGGEKGGPPAGTYPAPGSPEPALRGEPAGTPELASASIPAPTGTGIPRSRSTSIPGPAGTSIPGPAGTSIPRSRSTSIPGPAGTSIPGPAGTSIPRSRYTSIPAPTGTSIPGPAGTSIPGPTGTSIPGPAGTTTLWPATISREPGAGGPMKSDFDTASDGPRLLLYYILGTVVVILLLLAFALGLLICKKRRAQKDKKKSRSTTDNYCWVPEQAETKAVENDYR